MMQTHITRHFLLKWIVVLALLALLPVLRTQPTTSVENSNCRHNTDSQTDDFCKNELIPLITQVRSISQHDLVPMVADVQSKLETSLLHNNQIGSQILDQVSSNGNLMEELRKATGILDSAHQIQKAVGDVEKMSQLQQNLNKMSSILNELEIKFVEILEKADNELTVGTLRENINQAHNKITQIKQSLSESHRLLETENNNVKPNNTATQNLLLLQIWASVKQQLKYATCQSEDCPFNFVRHQCSCYYFANTSGSWFSGKEYCGLMGTHLAEITSQAEQEFLSRHVRALYLTDIGTFRSLRGFWLGGIERKPTTTTVAAMTTTSLPVTANNMSHSIESTTPTPTNPPSVLGVWMWDHSNTTITYANWGNDEPNNWLGIDEDCLALSNYPGNTWNDDHCTDTRLAYICEYELG